MNAITPIFTNVVVGLTAGLFYPWSIFVVSSLAQIPEKRYLLTLQPMNRAVLNPALFIFFTGQVLLLSIISYLFRLIQ